MKENEKKTSVQVTATEDNHWPFESLCVCVCACACVRECPSRH
jgi:hypothetical protein